MGRRRRPRRRGRARSPASTRCATRPRWSGSASTSPTRASYVAPQRRRHRRAARGAARPRLPRPDRRSPAAWSCTARARTAATEHGSVRPAPRTPSPISSAGRFEPACPDCGACARCRCRSTEDAPPDPRNVYAATKLHQEHLCAAYGREHDADVIALRYHNVYGPRMPRDTPYAGVASIFRSALAAGRRADGVRGRRPAARLRPRRRRRPGERARARRVAERVGGALQRRDRRAPHHPRDGAGDRGRRTRATHDPVVVPAVPPRRRPPRVRRSRREPATGLGFVARVRFEAGMRDFATAPCEAEHSRESSRPASAPYPGGPAHHGAPDPEAKAQRGARPA